MCNFSYSAQADFATSSRDISRQAATRSKATPLQAG